MDTNWVHVDITCYVDDTVLIAESENNLQRLVFEFKNCVNLIFKIQL